jgi:hypothetical protein
MKSPPPGPDTQGFASAAVLPVIPAKLASIRGRTNSLVIIELKIKKETPKGLLYGFETTPNFVMKL